jgi:hypothetical protein
MASEFSSFVLTSILRINAAINTLGESLPGVVMETFGFFQDAVILVFEEAQETASANKRTARW